MNIYDERPNVCHVLRDKSAKAASGNFVTHSVTSRQLLGGPTKRAADGGRK
jgi:hypothetical protein